MALPTSARAAATAAALLIGGAGAGAEDPRRPGACAVQGVPVLDPALLERLAPYRNIRQAGFAGFSSDGRGILVATRFGETTQLHRVYEPGGRREQVTFYDEPVEGRFLPGAGSPRLLVSASRGGDENGQIRLLDLSTRSDLLLTDGKSRNVLGPVRRDGSMVLFGSNRAKPADTDLYVMRPPDQTSVRRVLAANGSHWTGHDWSPDGKRVLVTRYVSITESYPFLLDVESGEQTPLATPGTRTESWDALAFSPEGTHVYAATDRFGEFRELVRFHVADGSFERLTTDVPWDVEDVAVDRVSGAVAFTVNEEGSGKLHLWRDGKRTAVSLPRGIVRRLEFSPDGKQLGFTLSPPNAPADAWTVSLDGLQATRWTFSEAGGLDGRLVAPSLHRCKTFDGREVPLWAYLPPNRATETRVPVVLHLHGGPESQFRPDLAPSIQAYVAELGMAVVCPNVRGSSGYGRTWLSLDDRALREDSVKDVGAVLDWIAAQEELDPNRVVVVGGSYGGYMVLASLVHYPERLRAGVDVVGIANFVTFLERTAEYRRDLRRAEYGDERDPEMRAVLERISPLRRANEIRSALLVVHGANDPRVPLHEAEQIVSAVRANGGTAWSVIADNEGHGFQKKSNRDYLDAVTITFLKEACAPKTERKP